MPDTDTYAPPRLDHDTQATLRVLARMALGENRPELPLSLASPEDVIFWDMIAATTVRCVDASDPDAPPRISFTNKKTKKRYNIIMCADADDPPRNMEEHLNRALAEVHRLHAQKPPGSFTDRLPVVFVSALVGALVYACILGFIQGQGAL